MKNRGQARTRGARPFATLLRKAPRFARRATRPLRGGRINACAGRACAPRTPHWIVAVCTFFALALTSLAADPGITVSAQQRYPWNGLVDVHFTLTGDAGTQYATSFTAKDMVGNTNIAMRTIRKADGSAANVAKEQLTPGTYNWVWDAAADLPDGWRSDRVVVTGIAEGEHGKVQLWAGGPYWAEVNIGAEKSTDYGYYFWWGDIIGYKRVNGKWVANDGSSSNFSFEEGNTPTCNKAVGTLQNGGWITADSVLTSAHDAAQVHWGVGWRMPTDQEFDDLLNKCDWTGTTVSGVEGYVVRGKGNYASASIFFPCAGYGLGTELRSSEVGSSHGLYWSSVPDSGNSNYSRHLHLLSWLRYKSSIERYCGQPVRPVQDS